MSDPSRQDVKIAGEGALPGGTYGNVTINAAGSINGDVDCLEYRVNGAGVLNGRLVSQSTVINGSGTINGSVQAVSMTVNGDASVRDGAGIARLEVKGNISVGGGLALRTADIKGRIRIGGDCDGDGFTGEASFEVGGAMRVKSIDVRLYGRSRARSIEAERLIVGRGGSWADFVNLFAEQELGVDTVKADVADLSYVVASVVRGNDIRLGEGCRIGRVEYSGTYSAHPNALVSEVVKV